MIKTNRKQQIVVWKGVTRKIFRKIIHRLQAIRNKTTDKICFFKISVVVFCSVYARNKLNQKAVRSIKWVVSGWHTSISGPVRDDCCCCFSFFFVKFVLCFREIPNFMVGNRLRIPSFLHSVYGLCMCRVVNFVLNEWFVNKITGTWTPTKPIQRKKKK